jgi:hypothetical protein
MPSIAGRPVEKPKLNYAPSDVTPNVVA